MAELLFNCPHCNQAVTCDDQFAGQTLQCPGCQQNFIAPAAAPPPGPAPRSPFQRQPAAAPNRNAPPYAPLNRPSTEAKGGAFKWVKIAAVVVLLGVGGYFGAIQIGKWQSNLDAASRKAEANSDGGQLGHIADVYSVLDATEPGGSMGGGGGRYEPARTSRSRYGSRNSDRDADETAPERQLPVIAPAHTLDIAAATIPESRVNGTISGTNFICDTARLDVSGTGLVLSLRQGTNASPDGEILVYLRPRAGEKIGGGSWTVSPEMKNSSVSQVAKRWKPNPKYAATMKGFTTGYALKLELGKIEFGELTGKIFVALPDSEHTVVAGIFQAETTLPDTPESTPAASAAP